MLVNIIQNTISSFRSALASAEVITTNLKMWLGFETSSIDGDKQITPDKSGNNNVGELFTGKALDFNGSTDYVDTTGFEMSGTSATFAFWIYPKDTAYQFVMDLDGTVRTILGLFNGGSGQVFAFFNFGFKQFGTPTQNQWQRVVFRVNATTVECYVDGVKSGSTVALTSSIDLSTVGNSVIGGRFDTSNTGNRFDGSLSDFQIYNAYWSTDDIAYDYANPQNLVTDRDGTSIELTNLKAYWHLSEGKGTTAYDSSGEGNNGTINGATYDVSQPRIPQLGMMNFSNGAVASLVTLIADPNNTSQDIDGNAVRDRLNSLNLDGSGYAEVADDASINPTDAITVECWVYWTNTSNDKGLVAKWKSGTADYMLHQATPTKFDFYIGSQNKRCATALSNGWNHIVGTYDKTNMKVYLNGDLDGTLAHTSAIPNSTQVLEIGRYRETANRSYSERIDDARIYDRALSATEVENNYNAGLSAHTN